MEENLADHKLVLSEIIKKIYSTLNIFYVINLPLCRFGGVWIREGERTVLLAPLGLGLHR